MAPKDMPGIQMARNSRRAFSTMVSCGWGFDYTCLLALRRGPGAGANFEAQAFSVLVVESKVSAGKQLSLTVLS